LLQLWFLVKIALVILELFISISKKNFKQAVTRNFVKRRIKHLIHILEIDKTSYNIIVIPKSGAETMPFLEMKESFQKLHTFLGQI